MTTAAVRLWGRQIGAVSTVDDRDYCAFQYTPEFAASGIEVAPISMPLSNRIYTFPALSRTTFNGLPGLLSDSLPDKFGNRLIDVWLANQGRKPESFNAVERLCYIGSRGIGALEFEPAVGPTTASEHLEVAQLVELASTILTQRETLSGSFEDPAMRATLSSILRVGTSAGGARAKALVAWNPDTGEVRSGQIDAEGFGYWLLKFDGVSNNRDKELADPKGFGAIEYAYYLMATAAGIDMMECRLLEEGGRRHFITRRFDRPDGHRLHMQSLCAMAHFDFNDAGAHSYEQAFQVTRDIGLSKVDVEKLYRRMCFNIVARNQDDHVKNIAYLMDRHGNWSLSPAYDMTYSYNPQGAWTARHQMSMNGKRSDFTKDDFVASARTAGLPQGRGARILDEVREVVGEWKSFAKEARIPAKRYNAIAKTHRLSF